MLGVDGGRMAMGAGGDEHAGGAWCRGCVYEGLGVVSGEGYWGEDELATALCDEAGETCSGVGGAEFDEMEVAIELLPVIGEDASACVGFVSSVFGAIGTCLALCDDTLGCFGDGMCAVGVVGVWWRRPRRRGGGGIGCEQSLRLFESFSCCREVFSQHLRLAIARGEELGELCV